MKPYTKETLGPVQEMHSGEQKILGVQWNTSTDRLCFNLEEYDGVYTIPINLQMKDVWKEAFLKL